MKIRKAKLKDLESCLKLSKQEGDKYWTQQDLKNCVADKDVEFFIAEDDGKIVGYAIGYISPTKRGEGLIHETRVSTQYRRMGIGAELVSVLSESFFKRKVKVIYAMIEPKHRPFYIGACKYKETGSWIEASKKK